MALPELWQFRFSLYPEMARWALDYKQVAHRRRSLLPGPHPPKLLLRFGRKSLPVLCDGDAVIRGSAAIIDYIEHHWSEPRLYPTDPRQRERAREIQRWFIDEVGPATRRAAFYDWLPDGDYAAARFAHGESQAVQRRYARCFPAIRALMRFDMRLTAAGAEAGRAKTREALDFVAREAAATGYLVGDRFTQADLAAATVLQLCVYAPEYPVPVPEPRPAGWRLWQERWQQHPGADYPRRIYQAHRGSSMEVS